MKQKQKKEKRCLTMKNMMRTKEKQLWLYACLFCELEDDPTSKDVFIVINMELLS